MALIVDKNSLSAKFSYSLIRQIRRGLDVDAFVIDFDEEPPLEDILYWSDEWNWECTTTINTGHLTDGIKWVFKSKKELEEFLLLFSLKWGNQAHVHFSRDD